MNWKKHVFKFLNNEHFFLFNALFMIDFSFLDIIVGSCRGLFYRGGTMRISVQLLVWQYLLRVRILAYIPTYGISRRLLFV